MTSSSHLRSILACVSCLIVLALPAAAEAAPKVMAGALHSCSLSDAGAMKCWGDNGNGAVGDGTTSPRLSPTDVIGMGSGIADIAADGFSSCGLLGDGSMKCWGSNLYGALGNGAADAAPHPTPGYVNALGGVKQITGGYYGYCALLTDGTAKCWGANPYGEVGSALASNPQTSPIAVQNLSGAALIDAGEFHSCAVLGDGTAKCWGYDAAGQLGNGPGGNSNTAQPVLGLAGATDIYASSYSTCAIVVGGAVQCWGANNSGQLGTGEGFGAAHQTPVDVPGISGAVMLGGSTTTACALLSNGQLKCWGSDPGNGSPGPVTTPVDVTNASDVTSVSRSPFGSHICAVHRGGVVSCWGSNGSGQLGTGTTSIASELSPLVTQGLDLVTQTYAPTAVAFAVTAKPKTDKKKKNYKLLANLRVSISSLLNPVEACSGAFVVTTSYKYKTTKRVKGKLKKVTKTKKLKTSPALVNSGNDCVASLSLTLPVGYLNGKKVTLNGAFAGNASLPAFTATTGAYKLPKVKIKKKKRK